MIMQWRRQPDNGYVARWQGMEYVLSQNRVNGFWYLTANGKTVNQRWAKSRQAMEQIESRQQKLILAAMGDGVPVNRATKYYQNGSCETVVAIGGAGA